MPNITDAVNISFYNYIISSFDIILPGQNPVSVNPLNINGFTIEKDFDNDYFPVFHMNMCLSPKLYYSIMNNKTTVKFRIRIDKHVNDPENPNKQKFLYQVINDTFIMFSDDDTPFLDKELYEKSKKVATEDEIDFLNSTKSYDFFLFKERDILASKKIVNNVLTSSNMATALTYLLSSSGISNILMSPVENNTTYPEVIIIPGTILNNIEYLNEQYGFYSHGLMVFFDLNITYVLPKRAACTVYRPNEYQNVLVRYDKFNNFLPGCYKDDLKKSYTIIVQKERVDMKTGSLIANQIEGNGVMMISPASNSVTKITPTVQQNGSNTNMSIVVNNFNNTYTNKALEYRKTENDKVINIGFSDMDIEALTPNKKYTFSFEDKDIQNTNGGDYRLSYTLLEFKKSGEEFELSGIAEFKKSS